MKKAKITISGIGEQKQVLLKVLNKAINDPLLLDEIGKTAVEQIRNRTRGRLEEYKQDPLSDDGKDQRERLIRAGNAFDRAVVRQPSTSNLSMSGQLLNSIYYRVNQALGTVSIMIKSQRNPYKGIRKDKLDGALDNNTVKDDLEDRGRKFFFISAKLNTLLQAKITAKLRQALTIFRALRRK